jgi:hypothetical protein
MVANSLTRIARLVFLALALAALTTPARAQQPSAKAIAMAKEIITLKGSATGYNTVVTALIERVKGMMLQTSPTLSKDLNDVAVKLRNDYAGSVATPLNEAAKLYASKFTEAELQSVLTFYKTPAGKKVIEQEPAIFQKSMEDLDAWSDRLGQEMIAKFRAEMKKKGHDL